MQPRSLAALLAPFPPEIAIDPAVVAATVRPDHVIVVLDDDPTGTQSVADLPVLTAWDEADFEWAFARSAPAVYVLTNARSLDPEAAERRNREVVTNALAAAARAGVGLSFASRSDSTLRGHFPLETDVIARTVLERTGAVVDGVVIVPAFPDAGRVTIAGTHYMLGPDGAVPVAETEFARDATFGYSSSDLREWVAEKSGGRWRPEEVVTLDLERIRGGDVAGALRDVHDGTPIVADAVTENDLRALALGLAEAEAAGTVLLYRVGPPFVRARIGQPPRAPLTASEIPGAAGERGGLIVVGSHVGLTSRQLEVLLRRRPHVRTLEVDVEQVLDARASAHLESIVTAAVGALRHGDVVIHTSRTLKRTDDAAASLDIARRVSAAVVSVVRDVLAAAQPRFVIAKGGITSSDVAAHGLGIRRAMVRGPMLPGIVSLWEPVDGPAAGIPYVVFAGNVGGDEALADVVAILSGK